MFETRYQKLNPKQRQAVDTLEGPVMVIAGPGSGKTELLALRAANILLKTDANPEDILCLTFTDSAAHNMRERLASIIGPEAYRIAVHTFHSFGREIINHYPDFFYDGAVFAPADDLTKISLLEEVIEKLQYDSPLRKFSPEQGYTFLANIQQRLEDFKKGGLEPEDLSVLLAENHDFEMAANPLLADFFAGRMSKAQLDNLSELIAGLEAISSAPVRSQALVAYPTERDLIVKSLQATERQIFSADSTPNTKPLTAWRNLHLKKDDANRWILKGTYYARHHQDLVKVYVAYQQELKRRGFFDFSDMIMSTARALETQNSLRFELQEKYRYVMVDEFQDTSGAQLRLLENLLNNPAQEGKPNILVVGDDDQAIYKFQGASLEHLLGFAKRFPSVKKVVLTQNYRSGQKILDYARWVIRHFDDRLENQHAEIVKDLQATGPCAQEGELYQRAYISPEIAARAVARQVEKWREAYPDQTVAVIARTHQDLVRVAEELVFAGVPVAYKRKQNLLADSALREVLTIARFAYSVLEHRLPVADELLPEVLSYEFWGLKRESIWKISLTAYAERKSWLETMRVSADEQIRKIAQFLIALGVEARTKSAEEIVDYITGSSSIKQLDFQSPWREFHFSKENFDERPDLYLAHLSHLRVFFSALRQFRPTEALKVGDLVEFLKLHETHNLPLYVESEAGAGENVVTLLTAHHAKGQEFDNVVILNCSESGWMKKQGKQNLPLPLNLPLSVEADGEDDFTRLFFVAITRTKRRLLLTFFTHHNEQKALSRLRFLDHNFDTTELEPWAEPPAPDNAEDLLHEEALRLFVVQAGHETDLLQSQVKNYQLSATHLNSFLNVAQGGPKKFLENHLLHFPRAITPQLAYGNAVHAAFTHFYREFCAVKVLPSVSRLLFLFERSLKMQNLSAKDFQDRLAQGHNELNAYYAARAAHFDCSDKLDVDFDSEAVRVGTARLTGKIDRIQVGERQRTLVVADYKTGGSFNRWNPVKPYEKTKALAYVNQLLFYKVLVENSRSFKGWSVEAGDIDFITPVGDQIISLRREFSVSEVEEMKRLIEIVYNKIIALDFPNTDKYPQNAKGMQAFRVDLLAGKV